MRLVEVGDIELEIHDLGQGDPVVLVQTALTADELAPLAALVATVARTARSSTTGAATWGAARSRGRDRSFAMPPTAEISSLPWAWTGSMSSATPTAAPWPCSSPLTPRTTSTP